MKYMKRMLLLLYSTRNFKRKIDQVCLTSPYVNEEILEIGKKCSLQKNKTA